MPDSLNYLAPSLYADDTVIYGSSNDCDDLVEKVNSDLGNIHNWMIQNKLQTHSKKAFVPLSTLIMLYNAIVQPYFDYCSPLWNNCGTELKNKLQKFQNQARVISGANYDIRSAALLKNLRWQPLEE